LKKVIILSLVILVVALAVIHDRNNYLNNKLDVPVIDDIASVQIYPQHAGAGIGLSIININLSDTMQRLTVIEILKWLKDSKLMGEAKDQFLSAGGSPTSLQIKLRNGKQITIVDAVGAISTKVKNSIASMSVPIKDQVTIYMKNKPVRVDSPELKEWIESGWKDLQVN
jgi:hypothetical protein